MSSPPTSFVPCQRPQMVSPGTGQNGLSSEATSPSGLEPLSSPEDVCLAVEGRTVRQAAPFHCLSFDYPY